MRGRIPYILLGAVVVAIIVGVAAWQVRSGRQSEQEGRTAVVQRSSMVVIVSASGSVEPQARADLAFETPGRVAEVAVEVEDRVEAGDLLAHLDTEEMALQVAQAEAALISAEARLAQLKAGPRVEEIAAAEADVRAAEAQVSAALVNLDQVEAGASDAQIAAGEADLASATARRDTAQDAHKMTTKCFTFKYMGQKQTICPALGPIEEQARYNLEAAKAALAASQAQLDELRAGPDDDQLRAAQANVWSATAQRDAAQAQLDLLMEGATAEQVTAAEAQVTQARVGLAQAELGLESGALRAPFGGTVAAVSVSQGERVSAGLPVVTLVDEARFRVVTKVDEVDVGRLIEGLKARVTLDALPGTEISGTVKRIAPAATIEGGVVYYDVIIELAPTEAPIRTDMTANATIAVEELSDALTIPTWMVRVDRTTGQTYVERLVGGRTERVDVDLGTRDAGVIEVLSGLSEGDVIVWVSEDRSELRPQ